MKKYIIKNADGSEQPVMQAVHESREEVNEVITDFKRAMKALGLKPNTYYNLSEYVPRFVSDINPKHIKALIALNELFTIAEAWNKEDGFVPDFSDWEQCKYFPWFVYNKDAAGFVFERTNYLPTYATVGSRLCFKTPERAEQFGKQFVDLYNEVFL